MILCDKNVYDRNLLFVNPKYEKLSEAEIMAPPHVVGVSHLLHKKIELIKEARQNWARLIQKKYEVDPLMCPKCQGQMKIISFIKELDVLDKILRQLGLWDVHNHDPPQAILSDSIPELVYDFSVSQIPAVKYWN